VPISAEKGLARDELLKAAANPICPKAEPMFGPDDITDRSERFWPPKSCAKSCSATSGEELPYGIAVEIEKFEHGRQSAPHPRRRDRRQGRPTRPSSSARAASC
jgi:GTPase Era involved in 16S rRNA processing